MGLFRSPRLVSLAEARGAVTAPGAATAPTSLDKHLTDYLRVLVRRRWTAVTTLGVFLLLAWLHLQAAVPIYETTVQILIEHENKEQFSLQQGVAADRETTDYYNTQYTILRSRSLTARTIDAMNAWKHPELTKVGLQPSGMLTGATTWATNLVKRLRGVKPPAPTTPAAGSAAPASALTSLETSAQSAAINVFVSRVAIKPVKGSRLVDVTVQAADPKFAAAAANALAKTYIEQNLELRMASSKETSDWLTEQLSAQRDRILTSENALQRYRENHDAISLVDRQNIVAQRLADLNGMVTKAKGDRISREALYNQMRAIQKREVPLDTLPSILSNSYLQQLKGELARLQAEYVQRSRDLGDQNPVMITLKGSIQDADAKLQRELGKQIEATQNEYEAARSLEASLTQALEAQKGEVTAMNRTGIDYSSLEREVVTNRQIFESLLARTREKGIAGELKSSDVRVIDAAQVPESPIWPNRGETAMYAAFFGSLIGIALAFFSEYVDDRIKTPDEIKIYLGLPFLGIVPIITKKEAAETRPLLHKRETVSPMWSEAFRALRTNVIFTGEDRARSIVVTSTGPGEGKTAVSTNLAIGLAMTGRQVLLLDVDMRCPQVHQVFDLEQQPGLSDLLTGAVKVREALRQTSVPSLWVMPCGGKTGNPAELLSSPRFAKLLELLAQKFEWVIIDSPPVAAVTDACIVANRASAVLFVVGAGLTRRGAALNAIEQLETANATFLGAVLNRVHLRRDAYYYSAYYRPSYEKYYTDTSAAPASDQFYGADTDVVAGAGRESA
jgi:succinoglycan biosynthesis transport protein ExoP